MTNRIMIAEEKHATRYFDASTDEKWAAASLALLTERFEDGYWYYEPEAPAEKELADEELPEIPENASETVKKALLDVRLKIEKARRSARASQARYEKELAEYREIERIVNEQDMSMVARRNGALEPKAWRILDIRSDYEYERIEIEYPTDITA